MLEQLVHTRVYSAGPFSRYDLQNAEERIAELLGYIERDRGKLRRLPPGSPEARDVRRNIAALERTLGHFQGHRDQIEEDLKGQ